MAPIWSGLPSRIHGGAFNPSMYLQGLWRWRPLKRQIRATHGMAVRLEAKVRDHGIGLRPGCTPACL